MNKFFAVAALFIVSMSAQAQDEIIAIAEASAGGLIELRKGKCTLDFEYRSDYQKAEIFITKGLYLNACWRIGTSKFGPAVKLVTDSEGDSYPLSYYPVKGFTWF